jgi:hypothetical protein
LLHKASLFFHVSTWCLVRTNRRAAMTTSPAAIATRSARCRWKSEWIPTASRKKRPT